MGRSRYPPAPEPMAACRCASGRFRPSVRGGLLPVCAGCIVAQYQRYAICCAAPEQGRVKWKLAPRGELLAAHRRPPCDSMIDWLMRSPIPVPLGLVVKNALKICSACSAGSPTPVSLTETST